MEKYKTIGIHGNIKRRIETHYPKGTIWNDIGRELAEILDVLEDECRKNGYRNTGHLETLKQLIKDKNKVMTSVKDSRSRPASNMILT